MMWQGVILGLRNANEAPRVHHASWWRSGVVACVARAAAVTAGNLDLFNDALIPIVNSIQNHRE
jgi:hypothetical protein